MKKERVRPPFLRALFPSHPVLVLRVLRRVLMVAAVLLLALVLLLLLLVEVLLLLLMLHPPPAVLLLLLQRLLLLVPSQSVRRLLLHLVVQRWTARSLRPAGHRLPRPPPRAARPRSHPSRVLLVHLVHKFVQPARR